eukprot:scaffold41469_cov62-Phaeocystis_antarctica.AAC.2
MELSMGKTRAAELLTAAAAHRTFVEHCLWKWDQQQTGHQLLVPTAEVLEAEFRVQSLFEPNTANRPRKPYKPLLVLEAEGWMTGEDAIEVACWHLQSTDTCDLAHGERSTTASHGMPLEPRSTHGKRPRAGTAAARLAGGETERRFQPWNAMAESQGREGRAGESSRSPTGRWFK